MAFNSIIRFKIFIKKNSILSSAYKRNEVKNGDILALYDKVFKHTNKSETLSLENIGKVYDNGFKAIHNFSLSIKPGEFLSFLGPSGCGKTTILRMIAGLEYISEGNLKMGDVSLNSALPQERSLSMVFQNYALYPYMDVYKNIAFGMKIATFNNIVSKNIYSEYRNIIDPSFIKRKFNKNLIKDLSRPNRYEIEELKKKIVLEKKSSTRNDLKYINLIEEFNDLKKKSKHQFEENKDNLKKLKFENKKLYIDFISNRLSFLNKKIIEIIKNINIKNNDNSDIRKIKIQKKEDVYKQKLIFKDDLLNLKKEKKELIKKEQKILISNIENIKSKAIILKRNLKESSSKIEKRRIKLEIKKTNEEKKYNISKNKSKKINHVFNFSEKSHILNEKNKSNKNKWNQKIAFEINKKKAKSEAQDKYQEYIESLAIWKYSIPERINYFSKMVGINKYLRRKPSELSGGQRQRVALVRAISKNVKLFLFDEPLSNLDAKLRGSMRTEIKSLHNQLGTTSIFVTHDQIEATTMSDRIVLMNKGYIQQIGTPEELFFEPSNIFVADFIGFPRINFLKGNLRDNKSFSINNFKDTKINFSSRLNLPLEKNKKIIIGIRPQDIIFDKEILSNGIRSNVFKGKIKQIENIGHEIKMILDVPKLSDNFVVIFSNKYNNKKVGEKVEFYINPSRIHLFNGDDGISLTSKINSATNSSIDVWKSSEDERIKNNILLDKEKNKEKISHSVLKDVWGLVNKKYGRERNLKKLNKKNKVYKDQSLADVNKEVGN